jgi:hypothetical protein
VLREGVSSETALAMMILMQAWRVVCTRKRMDGGQAMRVARGYVRRSVYDVVQPNVKQRSHRSLVLLKRYGTKRGGISRETRTFYGRGRRALLFQVLKRIAEVWVVPNACDWINDTKELRPRILHSYSKKEKAATSRDDGLLASDGLLATCCAYVEK